MKEKFTLKISPRMLELLSKDLYTNLYFVLAELIANAYDADAENVYIYIDDNEIRVEDDGIGMTAEEINNVYLQVGTESRTGKNNAKTSKKHRLKMGRKGIGKLAALSISKGFKLISKKNGEEIGIYVPKRIQKDEEELKVLSKKEYKLKNIDKHGTAIIMENPDVNIPKLQATIVNNLAKIFPVNIKDFVIHIFHNGKETIVTPKEKDAVAKLATLMIIGEEKKELSTYLSKDKKVEYKEIDGITKIITMTNNRGKDQEIKIRIYGWIGTYKTSKGMKKEINEFTENYLAIFAHNKMGLRNVLPVVGKNRIYESYIVGNLYIDAFEHPDLPDMASTNRQGYSESDPRWQAIIQDVRDITDDITKMHSKYAKSVAKEKQVRKQAKKEAEEQELSRQIEKVSNSFSKKIIKKLETNSKDKWDDIVIEGFNDLKPMLGLKKKVDASKKKILISQTYADKNVADIIYKMLLLNNVPKEDIIYSSGDDPETNLPERNIYEYLRKFFVQSSSTEAIYVLFVTSTNVLGINEKPPKASWGALMEIGAVWITKKDHWIFNINDFKPEKPLNTEDKWVVIKNVISDDGDKIVSMSESAVNSFCKKIIITCKECGYKPVSFDENKSHLIENYIEIID